MKIFRITLCFVTATCFVLGVCFSGVWQKEKSLDLNPVTYQGILKVWHVETFEGGVGSRKQFLLKSGINYEKENKGVLIMVTTHTVNSVEENFKKGIHPDLISYGVGLEIKNASPVKTGNKLSFTTIGEKEYAGVWCRGAYCLIENPNYKGIENESLTVSKGEFTNPLVALLGYEKKFNITRILPPLDAYINFVNGNSKYLLGTQRDVCRLNARGFNYKMEVLEGFSDLNQFISIVTDSEDKRYYAERYINHLLSKEVQEKLNEISMFSAYYSVATENENLQKINTVKPEKSLSPFIKKEMIKELYSLSEDWLKNGREEKEIKIKNLLS